MIKKAAILLVMLLYLGTATGFAFNLHYCCGKLVSLNLNAPVQNCSMAAKAKPGCCKSTHVEVKVKDAHEASALMQPSQVVSLVLPVALPGGALFIPCVLPKNDLTKIVPDPPPPSGVAFLKNCVFRI